jgi:type IV pilus assembly protein PilC
LSVLERLAKFYQREVNNAVDTLVNMIEPLLIVALAVGVGFLLAAVLLPIYNLSSSI